MEDAYRVRRSLTTHLTEFEHTGIVKMGSEPSLLPRVHPSEPSGQVALE